jgi:hypothetical protein
MEPLKGLILSGGADARIEDAYDGPYASIDKSEIEIF